MSSSKINYPAETLEFDQVLNALSELALTEQARVKLCASRPFQDTALLEEALAQVSEMVALLDFDEVFPLRSFNDIRISLKKAEVEGAFLNTGEFRDIQDCLVISRRIHTYFSDRPDKYPLINKAVSRLRPLSVLENDIREVISDQGEIRDSASPELRRLRRSLLTREGRIRQRLDAILKAMVKQGYAQEDRLTLREGRLVVPMKDGHAGRLQGVIIDQSSTGSTLFIEPYEILEANNEIRRLHMQEKREVERILKILTGKLRGNCPELADNHQCLLVLDVLYAKARYSQEIHGHAAKISEGSLTLKNARHPILLRTHPVDAVIPLTLEMSGQIQTLVITGPNAGGKTVALKTVGLLSMMHVYGLHVPAGPDSCIPVFSRIFADIGDRQSIEQDLSTFSSHIRHIAQIVREADRRTLVLVDEIGSATDPAEGSALAITLLRHLTRIPCLTVATTHMGALKVFAHEEPGVENGSMIFDQESLKPTYRFQMGIPGSSYAFEIARRYGLPDALIQSSQDLLGKDRGRLDYLILSLETEAAKTHELLEEAERKESRLAGLIALYEGQLERIKKEAESEKRKLVEETEKSLRDTNAEIERLVKEIRETGARRESIREVKQVMQQAKIRVKHLAARPQEPPGTVTIGDWVLWEGHSGRGEVVSDPDRKDRVLVQWGDIRLKVPRKSLRRTQGPKREKRAGLTSIQVDKTVRNEIDLRGLTAEEAVQQVEIYLGDAHSAGYSSVRIIHGKGTGVLRREIGNYLKNNRLVRSHRPGEWNEGDTGVTIVELK